METVVLTSGEVDAVCAIEEGHFADRKSRNIQPGKLTKTLSAFANADGGELFVGIEDDGEWNGALNAEYYNGHLQPFESLFPYSPEVDYEFLVHPDDGTVALHITIQKTRAVGIATDGKAYIRRGAQNLPAEVKAIEYAKGLVTHETAPIPYPAIDIEESETTQKFMATVVPHADAGVWLRKQRLIVEDKPTVAGTVLFHDEPQVHLPKASVKLYRYTTSDDEGTREELAYDPIPIEGPIYAVIHSAVSQTVSQVENVPLLGKSGLTPVVYPPEALHEIITNAVLHRDYSLQDDVHVRIFDNRIEVESPGRLPAHITPGNILDQRFSRNPVIVRLINKFPDPPNKDVGEGLNTAFRAMRKMNLRDPEIVDRESSVLVLIRHESLASAEERIVAYLSTHDSINNKEARDLLNRPDADRSVRRIFEKLQEAGEIERVPGTIKGGSRYRRK